MYNNKKLAQSKEPKFTDSSAVADDYSPREAIRIFGVVPINIIRLHLDGTDLP